MNDNKDLNEAVAAVLSTHQVIAAEWGATLECLCGYSLGDTSGDVQGRHDMHRAEVLVEAVEGVRADRIRLANQAAIKDDLRRAGGILWGPR